ncbi:alpha/beta hydrolase [Bradyrhizobium diazoefficiens]|nr:alpha/beta hydrolase [Bradyrhizobium diazoefficiens]MBR0849485.1 alpha/beta hydrolase [Bradyrhizobium diazoefficiens]
MTDNSDIRVEQLDASGVRIAVHRSGAGPALVCLHAIGHDARDYQDLMRRFGSTHEIVAIDWPGHGQSLDDAQPASADRYTEILTEVLRMLGLQDIILIGNSVGGAAALKLASVNPRQVRALVLCDPAGLQRVNLVARLVCRFMARRFAKGERGDPGFAQTFRRYYERSVLTEPAAHSRREEIIGSAYRVAPALRQAWESFGKQSADIRHLTARLECPVLYAWARKDRLVALSRCKGAVAATPTHRLKLFDASHSAFLEQPEEFASALRDFMT